MNFKPGDIIYHPLTKTKCFIIKFSYSNDAYHGISLSLNKDNKIWGQVILRVDENKYSIYTSILRRDE